MLQLTQKLSTGELQVQELPLPKLEKGMVLVKNHFSLISAGTESSTVRAARKNLIGKIKERPQQAKQVLELLQKQGPMQTYYTVMKKLDAYSPLGYSSSGEVLEVSDDVKCLKIGDKVACAGIGYASHAEVIALPLNLCVKLKDDAPLELAAYNALGAIAMQGIRQAQLNIGETCAIIGLGLLGQLTSLLLSANGITTIGIDINESNLNLAKPYLDLALLRDDYGIEERILNITNGIGVDSVIIAASSSSFDPINFAGIISRKKGKVIILGDVPTGFNRNPHWYKKELELKMACSYGPGRYDLNYEEKNIDYPVAYVRWTEKRNMEAFQELIYKKKIDIGHLTTHKFKLIDAPIAYDIILKKKEPYIGIILEYNCTKEHEHKKIVTNITKKVSDVRIAFIGAGSYAQSNLLPHLGTRRDVICVGILTRNGTTSKRIAEKFKFLFCCSHVNDIINNVDINTIFIVTRHDTHAEYVIEALKNNKNVFVEKPLCLNYDQLEDIKSKKKTNNLMVGFNRRFSPLSKEIKKVLSPGPMSMIYRINAGFIAQDSWIQDKEIGGGRIIGEVCHFIDYLTYINGSMPIKVSASALPSPEGFNDTINILIDFENNSSGVIAYYANGSKAVPKEYIEIYKDGITIILSDFKELTIFGKNKTVRKKMLLQDKGQKNMINEYIHSLRNGYELIPFNEICSVTKTTLKINMALKESSVIKV